MRKFGTFIARFFAVIFAISFVTMALVAMLLFNVDRRLMNADTYKNILANQQVYERLPRVLAEQMVMTMDYNPCKQNPLLCEGASVEFQDCAIQKLGEDRYATLLTGDENATELDLQNLQPCVDQFGADLQPAQQDQSTPVFIKALSVTDWEDIISILLPADELKSLTEKTIDDIFAYLSGQKDTASVSLVALKNRISGPAGVDAVLKIIRAQEPCTAAQADQMMAVLQGSATEMSLCKPSEETLTTMTPLIQSLLADYAASLPDEQFLLSPESGENSNGPMGNLGSQTRILRFTLRASPDLPLLFLLLITLLAVRSPKSWLRWWGIPFFVSGLLAFGTAITASAMFEQAWISLLAGKIPPYFSLGVVTLFHDLLRALSQTWLTGIRVGAFLLGLLGLAMWVSSYFLKPRPEPEPQPETNE